MVSRFEDALLRSAQLVSPGQLHWFRKDLFHYLDDGTSLQKLRAMSRVLQDLVDHQPGRLFRKLYLRAPLGRDDRIDSLEIVAPFCHSMIITIRASDRTSWQSATSSFRTLSRETPPATSKKVLARTSRYKWRTSSDSRSTSVLTARASTAPGKISIEDKTAQEVTRRRWLSIFSRCHQMQTLFLRVHGDPAWPGRTDVEEALITIRGALEQANPPKLEEVSCAPIHAMGIIHLRWAGLGVFAPPSLPFDGPRVWEKLDALDLQLKNPFVTGKLTVAQQTMFKKILYDYLRSFTPTLRVLRFVWLDADGPSPLILHLDSSLEGRRPLKWQNLEELWLGGVAYPHRTIQSMAGLAPKLERLWMLRTTDRESTLHLNDADAWIDVLLGKVRSDLTISNVHKEPRTWADTTSSVYSQSTRASAYEPWEGGVSRSSRMVPITMDPSAFTPVQPGR